MTDVVKFYGGPLHGSVQAVRPGEYRIDAMDYRHWQMQRNYYDPYPMRPPSADTVKKVSYGIEKVYERRGNMYRMLLIGLLEGTKLLPREEWELQRDLDRMKWQPVRVPRFLTEFERWYNVKMYEFTGRSEFVQEEFYLI